MRTADGWDLAVTVHPAVGEAPRSVCVLLHAMMVDATSLDRPPGRGLASVLAEAGHEVWRTDLRGHGKSRPRPKEGGRWTYDDLVRGDLPALVSAAGEVGAPVVVVGHSLGAHVATAAAADGVPIDALVLLAGNVWMPSLEPSRRLRWEKAATLAVFEAIARTAGRFPSKRLRYGRADEATDYVRDLCRFWWNDRFAAGDGTDWREGLGRYRGRVLSVAGAADRILARPESVRRFCAAFPPGAVEEWVAGRGTFGLDFDPNHAEVACDPRSGGLWQQIGGWITRAVAGS